MVTGRNQLFENSLYEINDRQYCNEEIKHTFDNMIVEAYRYFSIAREMIGESISTKRKQERDKVSILITTFV